MSGRIHGVAATDVIIGTSTIGIIRVIGAICGVSGLSVRFYTTQNKKERDPPDMLLRHISNQIRVGSFIYKCLIQ